MANQIEWYTPTGIIASIQGGEPFQFQLEANTGNIISTYSIINGTLPPGLSLASVTTPNYLQGLIYGTPPKTNQETTYTFTIRIQSTSSIADQTFSIVVFGAQPMDIVPGNLGIFPDGNYISTYIPTLNPNLPVGNVTYDIVSGSLPYGLNLNYCTGNINGYVNPIILRGSEPWDIYPYDSTPWDYSFGANSLLYSVNVRVTTQDLPITAAFNMTIERSDLYNNANANLLIPYYHNPYFIQATHYANSNGNTYNNANIVLGATRSDDSFIGNLSAIDFDNDTLAYQLVTGNAAPYIKPSNIQINGNTGWITGYVNELQASTTPYQFAVRAFKQWSEGNPYVGNTLVQLDNATYTGLISGNISIGNIFNNDYQTLMPISLQVMAENSQNISWISPANIGTVSIGNPSTLRISSEVSTPFITTVGAGATANAFMQVVGMSIIFGGSGYEIDDVLSVVGGQYGSAATLTVASIGNDGTILEATLNAVESQNYSELPLLVNSVSGGHGSGAQVQLSFGINTIQINQNGSFYPGVLIGFDSEGEDIPADAHAQIGVNGQISSIVVDNPGSGYSNVPDVYLNSYTTVTNANPISYSLVSGQLPLGLELLSNGMIVGRPSFQNNVGTETFTVKASVGSNSPVNSNGMLIEDDQITFSMQTFTVGVTSAVSAIPISNLSMEFLLSPRDNDRLQDLISNVVIVPNDVVYRTDDFYFGRVPNYRMLIGYGLGPVEPDIMTAAMAKYNSRKRFLITSLNWAQCVDDNENVIYEVIYAIMVDEFTSITGNTITGPQLMNVAAKEITVDTTDWSADTLIWDSSFSSGPHGGPAGVVLNTAYPSSIPNIIQRLRDTVSDFQSAILPGWMTSIQPNGQYIGYIPAMPLVYCNPGSGKYVLNSMQDYIAQPGKGLNLINAVTDRYVWDLSFQINWDITNNTWNDQVDGFVDLDAASQYIEFKMNVPAGAGF